MNANNMSCEDMNGERSQNRWKEKCVKFGMGECVLQSFTNCGSIHNCLDAMSYFAR